jgi:murein L,D-transpeptidase YafK
MLYKTRDLLLFFLVCVFANASVFAQQEDQAYGKFKQTQLEYPRVKTAYHEKEDIVYNMLNDKGIHEPHIFLQAFKKEQVLELWAKNKSDNTYQKITSYDFSAFSGSLGPKRRVGDFQIPEGVYYIDRFNPWSNYYLSLKINYPNKSDKILGDKYSPGSNIFIHGDQVTIGCIPITDDKIKELYVFAVEATDHGQDKIPVYIFPFRMKTENPAYIFPYRMISGGYIKNEPDDSEEMTGFWKNVKKVYDYIDQNKSLPDISIDSEGKYQIKGQK